MTLKEIEHGELEVDISALLLPFVKTKYHLFVSQEVYSVYLEIIKGNNTYSLLQEATKKSQPQLVEIMQPLIKSGVIKKKPFTGVRRKPAVYFADEKTVEKLFYTFLKESNYSAKDILKIKLKIRADSLKQFLTTTKNFESSKTFVDLSERFFDSFGIKTTPDALKF